MTTLKKTGKILFSALFWIMVWYIAALLINKELLLPSPGAVLTRLIKLAGERSFYEIAAASLLRIFLGAAGAVAAGVLLAVITSKVKFLEILFSPLMAAVKAAPVASFIILALVFMGRESVPVFISFLIVLPVVYGNVNAGINGADKGLLEMARVYRLPRIRKLKRIYIPSVMPFFLSAVETSIGLAWKAGIAAEVLTVPARSIGKMIYESKLYLEITDLFAWTVAVVIFSFIIEKAVVFLIKTAGKKYNTVQVNGSGEAG